MTMTAAWSQPSVYMGSRCILEVLQQEQVITEWKECGVAEEGREKDDIKDDFQIYSLRNVMDSSAYSDRE